MVEAQIGAAAVASELIEVASSESAPAVVPARRWFVPVFSAFALVVLSTGAWGILQAGRTQPESVEAMRRGEDLLRRGDARGAVTELQEAIARDPRNGYAHGVLAHALNHVSYRAAIPAPDGRSPSVEAAERGVELDPACAPCQGTLGLFLFTHAWDWQRAEWHLSEALRLDPSDARIRPSYALLLATTGRLKEALVEIDRALAHAPYEVGWLHIRATILYLDRRYEEAVASADQALLIDDTHRGVWDVRSKAMLQLGRAADAVGSLTRVIFRNDAAHLDRAVRDGGQRRALETLLALTDGPHVREDQSWRRAVWHAALGNTESAVAELEVAVEKRLFNAIYFGVDPALDRLRDSPRYQRVLERLGLASVLAVQGISAASSTR
jgi:tetratricopeptide (TPR) repeat protein